MPAPKRYAAFLSYAHAHRDWVETFHRHLEQALALNREQSPVFLDKTGLCPGMPWGNQLERALEDSERFVLVVTPETLASPWSRVEQEVFRAEHPLWQRGRFVPVLLVRAPLPPFVGATQYVDLVDHDDGAYRSGLGQVVARLLDWQSSEFAPQLPEAIAPPEPPRNVLPHALRSRLVDGLAPLCAKKRDRMFLAQCLGIDAEELEGFASEELAASAALVLSAGTETPDTAAVRVVQRLTNDLGGDEPELIRSLQQIAAEIRALDRKATPTASAEKPLLQRYREQLCLEHERLVDFLHRDQEIELLDRVFVDLELVQRRQSGGDASAPLQGDKRQLTQRASPHDLRGLLALDPTQHSWVTRRWIVLGDPGSGKTTLLRHLTHKLAAGEVSVFPHNAVPLFASIPRLLRQGRDPLDALEHRLGKTGESFAGLARALEAEGKDGRLLLLLDGLDEVAGDERTEAESLLRKLHLRFPESAMVITSRPVGYRRPLQEGVELELRPLDRQRRLDFLARWYRRRDEKALTEDEAKLRAAQDLAKLEGDRDLWELSGNPLYLTLMALILERDETPDRNRAALYDRIFELLLEGKHRRQTDDAKPLDPPDAVRGALRFLATSLTEEDRIGEPLDATVSRFYREEADAVRAALQRNERWQAPRAFLDELAQRSGIYADHDGPDADWRFWHKTFREALASEELKDLLEHDPDALYERARSLEGNESRWAEPFALLTGRVEQPDALVQELLQANRTLGLRALATAPRLDDATIRAALELSGDIEERGKVLCQIPSLLGEPERALSLVQRLAEGTRNGADLFFLDLACEEAATALHPNQPENVERERRRLYAHIPPPPADLFETIATRDGAVPLWCRIPEGAYWVGSPEGGRYDDERPRHRVELPHGFRIAAVPVTIAQYAAFDPEHQPYSFEGVPEEEAKLHPVQSVTWWDAVAFCRWLSITVPGLEGARLPTEEEWEIACRAGSDTAYWSGDEESDLERVGWYSQSSETRTHRVGEKPANPWGLYDVHGNVWEWTASAWRDNYAVEPDDEDPTTGGRVLRGGSWNDVADFARSAYRGGVLPWGRDVDFGFRVLLPAVPEPMGA